MDASDLTLNPDPPLVDSSETQTPIVDDHWERRARERHSVSDRAVVRRHADSEYPVDLVDLSEDGAGVWSTSVLAPGEIVELLLPQRRADRLVIEAVVVDRRSLGAGAWRLGLHFLQRLRPDELASALD